MYSSTNITTMFWMVEYNNPLRVLHPQPIRNIITPANMEFTASTCYEVRHFEGQGNGLFASRDIEKGEMIFKEFPFVWSGFKAAINLQSSFCYSCGECITSLDIPIRCDRGCQIQFCSSKCHSTANNKGHSFICSCYKRGGLVDRFSQTNKTGHLALALQCYMHIAKVCVDACFTIEETTSSHVKRCADMVLGGYHKDDFCRANHAVRTGRTSLPDMEMFETLIAPAYFATHLAEGLESIREVFVGLPLTMWDHRYHCSADAVTSTDNGESTRSSSESEAAQLREAFLFAGAEGIFHPMFFRHLVGMFVVNNHHVHLQSPDDASVQLLGTALYPTVSKMNHSCECNTTNSHSKTDVQLAVYTTAAVLKGQELTTSYLHRRPDHAKQQSRRSRHKCMLQYLFTCTCPKCEQERLLAQSIRRAKRGDTSTDNVDSEYSDDEEEESSSDEEDEEYSSGFNVCY